VYSPFQFHERRQYFIGTHDETLSVVPMRVNNPDRSPFKIECSDVLPFGWLSYEGPTAAANANRICGAWQLFT